MSLMPTNADRTVTGIVAQDKHSGSREILVHLQDSLPFTVGELKPEAQVVQVQTQDKHQGSAAGEATETNVVRAIFRGDSESDLPPNVVKGEQVEIIQDANTNTIYWTANGRTARLRSRDAKEMRVPNEEGYSKTVDDANSYFIKIDTLTTKEIRLQTCMSDKEEFAYSITIRPLDKTITISDNENNEIQLESSQEHIHLRNKSQSIVDITKENILVGCKDTITLKAEKQIIFNSPVCTHEHTEGDQCVVINAKGVEINATECTNINSQCIGLHGNVEARSIVAGPIQAESYTTGPY